jgi:RNA polymerase sigma factor (sigma-70 family)
MASGQANKVAEYLRQAVRLSSEAALTDGQLLGRFLAQRDEAAFAALLRRHGPLVWGVCRRALADHQDAEDAFQATFLVLARKAASIASHELLANWLYGVARRTALKARAAAARRQARERPVAEVPEPAAPEPGPWRELLPLLDQEISRLPDRYRAPVVLCDLEGKTRREAARELGVPEGTVGGRLARARALLAKRLRLPELVLSGGALAALAQGASADLPQSLASGVASAKAVALAEGVLKAMRTSKVKAALAACLVGALVLGGAFGYRTSAGIDALPAPPEKKTPAADKAPAAHSDNKLRDTLLVLDKQWWEAASNYDVDTLMKLMADDYVGFSPDGNHWTRKVMVDRCRSSRYTNVRFPGQRIVTRVNEHTAMVSYEVVWGAYDKGTGHRPTLNHDRVISCWVQRDGGWFLRYRECVNRVNFPDRRGLAPGAAPAPFLKGLSPFRGLGPTEGAR